MSPQVAAALLATTALVAVGLLRGGASGDGDSSATSGEADSSARYCELSRELTQAGEEAFRELAPSASQKEIQQAESDFVRLHADQLDTLESAAPAEIQAEVRLLLDAFRAGGEQGNDTLDRGQVSAAERSVSRFDRENCPES